MPSRRYREKISYFFVFLIRLVALVFPLHCPDQVEAMSLTGNSYALSLIDLSGDVEGAETPNKMTP